MAAIYITNETEEKLNKLVLLDRRTKSAEIAFLCEERIKQLDIPDEVNETEKV